LLSGRAVKQSVSFDLLAQGLGWKKVFWHISQEINNFGYVPCEWLAMVQFPADGHFIDINYIGNVSLEKISIKTVLPYMVAKGQESLRICPGNRVSCLDFEMAEWQRNHESAGTSRT
jgi:hypothetical protein